LQPTPAPQIAKWYPQQKSGGKVCVEGSNYDPSWPSKGWTYKNEDECCKAWELECGTKEIRWYPTSSNGKKECVQGNEYPWSFISSGWVFTTKQKCCDGMDEVDCSPPPEKWHPTMVNGNKACIFGEVDQYTISFDSKGECCAEYPEACPTTTTTTTTTRPAVTTPPCEPSGGKGCHWWPKIDMTTWQIACKYTSDWPDEAAGHLYSEHDSCYCEFHDC
jgi:hypothetical protein